MTCQGRKTVKNIYYNTTKQRIKKKNDNRFASKNNIIRLTHMPENYSLLSPPFKNDLKKTLFDLIDASIYLLIFIYLIKVENDREVCFDIMSYNLTKKFVLT